MSEVGDVTIRLKADIAQLEQALKRADADLRATATGAQAASQQVVQSLATWTEFLKGRMGPAMREAMAQGTTHAEAHKIAIGRLSAEYQALKASVGGVAAASKPVQQANKQLQISFEQLGQAASAYAGVYSRQNLGGAITQAARAQDQLTTVNLRSIAATGQLGREMVKLHQAQQMTLRLTQAGIITQEQARARLIATSEAISATRARSLAFNQAIGQLGASVAALTTGPLSGFAFRIIVLKELTEKWGFGIAALAGVGVAAGVGLSALTVASARSGEEMRQLQARLSLVTDSGLEMIQMQRDMADAASRSRTSLSDFGSLLIRSAMGARDYGIAASRMVAVSETVAKSLAITRTEGAQAQAVILQFGQALSSGELRGDELRTLRENAMALLKAIAEGMGITIGELYAAAEAGQLTTEKIIVALEKSGAKINEQFAALPPTMRQGATAIINELKLIAAEIDKTFQISPSVSGFLNRLKEGLAEVRREREQGAHTAQVVGENQRLDELPGWQALLSREFGVKGAPISVQTPEERWAQFVDQQTQGRNPFADWTAQPPEMAERTPANAPEWFVEQQRINQEAKIRADKESVKASEQAAKAAEQEAKAVEKTFEFGIKIAELRRKWQASQAGVAEVSAAGLDVKRVEQAMSLERERSGAMEARGGATFVERLEQAERLDALEKRSLEANRAKAQAELDQLDAQREYGKLTELEYSTQANALQVQIDGLEQMIGLLDEAPRHARALTREFINIGDTLDNIASDMLTGLASGTGRWQESGKRVAETFVGELVRSTVKEKHLFDFKIRANLLEYLPGIGQQGGEATGQNFVSGMVAKIPALGRIFGGTGAGAVSQATPGQAAGVSRMAASGFSASEIAGLQQGALAGTEAGTVGGSTGAGAANAMMGGLAIVAMVAQNIAALRRGFKDARKISFQPGASSLDMSSAAFSSDYAGQIWAGILGKKIGGTINYAALTGGMGPLLDSLGVGLFQPKTEGTIARKGAMKLTRDSNVPRVSELLTRNRDGLWDQISAEQGNDSWKLAANEGQKFELYFADEERAARFEQATGLRAGTKGGHDTLQNLSPFYYATARQNVKPGVLSEDTGMVTGTYGLATALGENNDQIIFFMNTWSNQFEALGLSAEETQRQIQKMAAEGGVTWETFLDEIATKGAEGGTTMQALSSATGDFAKAILDLPPGVDAGAVALANMSENAGQVSVEVANIITETNRAIEVFGNLEKATESGLKGAISAAFVAGATGEDIGQAFQANFVKSLRGALTTTLVEGAFDAITKLPSYEALQGGLAATGKGETADLAGLWATFNGEAMPVLKTWATTAARFADMVEVLPEQLRESAKGWRDAAEQAELQGMSAYRRQRVLRGKIGSIDADIAALRTDDIPDSQQLNEINDLINKRGGYAQQLAGSTTGRRHRQAVGELNTTADMADWLADQSYADSFSDSGSVDAPFGESAVTSLQGVELNTGKMVELLGQVLAVVRRPSEPVIHNVVDARLEVDGRELARSHRQTVRLRRVGMAAARRERRA